VRPWGDKKKDLKKADSSSVAADSFKEKEKLNV
jgi:hypothetical protein